MYCSFPVKKFGSSEPLLFQVMSVDGDNWTITRVVSVTKSHLKRPWLPQVKECDGKCFFKFEKFDRQVVMALTGKGLELRSSKEPHLLNSEAYDAIIKLRNDACTEAYIKMMKEAAAAAGDKWEQGKSCPTDDHRYTVSQTVDIMLPEIKRDDKVAGPQKVPCCRNICVKQIV